MRAGETNVKWFALVLAWIRLERQKYQTKKFDYEAELDMPVEYWEQQFDSYIQRLRHYPTDSEQYAQAALKLAATTIAHAEHVTERLKGKLPKPGVPSGTLERW